ncbi:sensor histidine kinase [Nocardioides sp. KR10-350]|uniref:sensor histidine kinase n=1 Tax=Nocardioides cheoyonin TaxID=3156615 RepID=UPI0032B5354F
MQRVHGRKPLVAAGFVAGWATSAVMAYASWRMSLQRTAEAEARAAEAERTREETAKRRAVEERLRIARDLHDSLTHSISVIKVQAGVAVHLAEKRGEEVPPALRAISEASSEAARELRATLSVLRDGTGPNRGGLTEVDGLAAAARESGVAVRLQVAGEERPLPDAVDHTAYRIVQEALTNVCRHAAPGPATVDVEYAPDALVVRVDNDGPVLADRPTPGWGLIGMRERVTELGGRLEAGPRPTGGFSVRAELPAPA